MSLDSLGFDAEFERQFGEFFAERRLGSSLVPARVVRQDRGSCLVHDGRGEQLVPLSGQLCRELPGAVGTPVVGDWVAVEPSDEGPGLLWGVLPRRTRFARKAAGTATHEQVVAANVDRLLVVVALDVDFSVRRIDRYVAAAKAAGIEPVVVLNKADLVADPERLAERVRKRYPALTLRVTSAVDQLGLGALKELIDPGKTHTLVGSSGVGKSTLINLLIGVEQQSTQATRERDSRGQHTTSRRELIQLPSGGLLIDTPGMREFGLWLEQADLDEAFEDVAQLGEQCRFRNCSHSGEPGCAVRGAIDDGSLSAERYDSYEKLSGEVGELSKRQLEHSRRQNKKSFTKQVTRHMKALRKQGGKWER